MKQKSKKNKDINQTSFYFEDYLETNKKNKVREKSQNFQDRIYLLFFFFFSLIFIFSLKMTVISLNKKNIFYQERQNTKYALERRDIVDRNNIIISGLATSSINLITTATGLYLIKQLKNLINNGAGV